MPTEFTIDTENLTKNYGDFRALDGVSLKVPTGSIFGFLGPNGAGKSTMIRILMGLLRATDGTARIFDRDVWHDGPAIRREIGYLPGSIRFRDFLTGRAMLDFANDARGGGHRAEMMRLADRLSLDLERRIRTYSSGMKQKLGLILALMHKPQLLILDEPTTALDPLVQQVVFDELRETANEGRTVLFSSHTLAEVEQLCKEVAILRAGEIVEQDHIERLKRRSLRHVTVQFRDGAQPAAMNGIPQELQISQQSDGYLSGSWKGDIAPLLRWMADADIEDARIEEPRLEDLFIHYYNSDVNGTANAPTPQEVAS